MADPTTYSRIVLKFSTPYARTGDPHLWSLKFSLSGVDLTTQAAADALAASMWTPVARLTSSSTSFVGYSYYKHGSAVAAYVGEYPVGTYEGSHAAYTGANAGQQLEVVALAKVRVGTSSKGKPTYLYKHIHDVAGNPSAPGELAARETDAVILAEWDTGAGPNNQVPVSPTTGDAPTTPWALEPALYTRQLRKGQKAKA